MIVDENGMCSLDEEDMSYHTNPTKKRKTGKWIDGVCSVCNEATDIVESRYFKYCPYCGTIMEAEVDNG